MGRSPVRRWVSAALVMLMAGTAFLVILPTSALATFPPNLDIEECPGGQGPLGIYDFTAGTYELASDDATFVPSSFTVNASGTATPVTVTVNDDATAQFAVEVTPEAPGTAPFTTSIALRTPNLSGWVGRDGYDDNPVLTTGGCFNPGETVDLSVTGADARAPLSTVANSTGNISFFTNFTAGPVQQTATVQATSTGSNRVGVGFVTIPPTTLFSGEELLPQTTPGTYILFSPDLSYMLYEWGCSAVLDHNYLVNGHQEQDTVWFGGTGQYTGSCALRLLSDGDLIIQNTQDGWEIWHSATENTGSHNRLVVENGGDLVLYNGANDLLWSSRTGLIRGAHGYLTNTDMDSSRDQATVHIWGTVTELKPNGSTVAGAGRVVILQREVGNSWQNYRTVRANSSGRVSFTFAQWTDYWYRLYVPATAIYAAAYGFSQPE